MKINEIVRIGQLKYNPNSFNKSLPEYYYDNVDFLTSFGDVDLYFQESIRDNSHFPYGSYDLVHDNYIIGKASVYREEIASIGDLAVIGFVKIMKEWVGKGLGRKFYEYIIERHGIMSDGYQTLSGKRLWMSLAKNHHVKAVNLNTQVVREVDPKNVYGRGKGHIRLFIEKGQ